MLGLSEFSQQCLTVVGALFLAVKIFSVTKRVLFLMKIHLLPTYVDFKKYGKWAVVTGATDGIGKRMAHELASFGLPVVLISRGQDKLKKVAEEIEIQHGVETKILEVDFKSTDIYDRIGRLLEGLDVGVLVNNVGMCTPIQPFLEHSDLGELCKDMVNVNVLSMYRMCQLVMPGMKNRRRGLVLNLASVSAIRPIPCMAMYGSTKCLIDYFSEALRIENKEFGIEVQSVLPSFVRTNMTFNKKWGFFVAEVEPFVRSVLATVGKVNQTHGCLKHEFQAQTFKIVTEDMMLKKMKQTSKVFLKFLEEKKYK